MVVGRTRVGKGLLKSVVERWVEVVVVEVDVEVEVEVEGGKRVKEVCPSFEFLPFQQPSRLLQVEALLSVLTRVLHGQ